MDRAAARADLETEDVAIPELRSCQLLLSIPQDLHRAHRVAELCGLLESLVDGGTDHPVPQRVDQLVGAAFEQQPRVRDRHTVLFLGTDLGHAWRDAALDVVFETWPSAFAGDHFIARADAKQPV